METMDIRLTLKHPVKIIPWRNNNFSIVEKEAPLSEQAEIFTGVYLLVLGLLSWIGNITVISVLYRQRLALQPTDLLTLNLAFSDVGIAVFGYSRGIVEIFNIFRDEGYVIKWIWTCQVNGFLTLLFGLASMNTLTVISVTRYIKGCHSNKGTEQFVPFQQSSFSLVKVCAGTCAEKGLVVPKMPQSDIHNWARMPFHFVLTNDSIAYCISRSTISISIISIWMGALFWSMVPLLGWGSYTDRGYGTCEVDWSKANYSTIYKSFVISVLTSCFAIPALIMLFSFGSIINTVKGRNAMSADGYLSERRRKVERDVTRVSLAVCTAFLLAWSPYAVVSMRSAWGLPVPSTTSMFARLLAKSACFYNPFIYLIMSSKFRKDVAGLMPCSRETREVVHLQQFKPLKPKAEPMSACLQQGAVNQTKLEVLVDDKDSGVNSPPHTPPLVSKEVSHTLLQDQTKASGLPEFENDQL